MKAKLTISVMLLGLWTAWAQTAAKPQTKTPPFVPPSQAVAGAKTKSQPAAKPAMTKPMATKPMATKPTATKAAAKKPAATKAAARKPAASKPATAAAAPIKEEPQAPMHRPGRRDPFTSPIVTRSSGGPGINYACAGGKRCLQVDQIVLRGVVKAPGGMIAVVENQNKKAYFLRENDPILNGYVIKITPDSVVFRETSTDNVGKPVTREKTLHVSAPAV